MKLKHSAALAALLFTTIGSAQIAPPMPEPDATTMPKDTLTSKDKMAIMDVNKDGLISRKEAQSTMLKDWKQWDSNNDGAIDATEFAAGSKAPAPAKTAPDTKY